MAVWGELKVVLVQLCDEQPGVLTGWPNLVVEQVPPFGIMLAPWATATAAELHRQFGGDVQLTVGALPYPPGRPPRFRPATIAGVKAALPTVNFALSLGGGNPQTGSWPSPGDPESWVKNATSSITGIMQEYGLDGVDVDYETGLDDTFVPVMSSLIPQVSPAFWSLAPDNQNLDTYLNLYNTVAASGVKPAINFQAYSMETTDQQQYIDKYTYIRNNITSFHDRRARDRHQHLDAARHAVPGHNEPLLFPV